MTRTITFCGKRMSPRTAAIAYRIAPFRSRGYTSAEVGQAIGETPRIVGAIIQRAGWAGKFTTAADIRAAAARDTTGFPDLSVIDATNAIASDMRRQLARAEE